MNRYPLINIMIYGILCVGLGIWIATPEREEYIEIPDPPYSKLNSERCGFCWSMYEGQMRMIREYDEDAGVWHIRPELKECFDRLWKEQVQLSNFENPQVEM